MGSGRHESEAAALWSQGNGRVMLARLPTRRNTAPRWHRPGRPTLLPTFKYNPIVPRTFPGFEAAWRGCCRHAGGAAAERGPARKWMATRMAHWQDKSSNRALLPSGRCHDATRIRDLGAGIPDLRNRASFAWSGSFAAAPTSAGKSREGVRQGFDPPSLATRPGVKQWACA